MKTFIKGFLWCFFLFTLPNLTHAQFTITFDSITDVSCNGNCDGYISTSLSGGIPPYNYTWSSGDTTAQLSNVCEGLYEVTVTDIQSQTAIDSVYVNAPSVINVSLTTANESCAGAADGSASITTTGGTTPYTYNWSSGGTAVNENNLAPGSYSITVTDANGCLASETLTINAGANITLTVTANDETCAGSADGNASVTATGGTTPYTYNWSNGGTSATVNNLAASSYSVNVSDANGCSAMDSVTVNTGASISASINSNEDYCLETSTASVYPTGGTSPYTYLWSTSDTSNSISNLTDGQYWVEVTDANGCISSDTTVITGSSGDILSVSATGTDETCNGLSDGMANAVATGGTGTISFYWTNGANTDSIVNLSPDTYVINVWDVNECSATDTIIINAGGSVTLSATATDETCAGANDGSVDVSATGGTVPYTYNWSSGDTTATVNNLSGGTFIVDVSDANGCMASDTLNVNAGGSVVLTATASDENCAGTDDGSASVTATGGTAPYTYNWSSGDTTATINNLAVGSYSVNVSDVNGCSAMDSVTVNAGGTLSSIPTFTDATCAGNADGSASVSISGGVTPYTYNWSSGNTSATANNLTAGTYTVDVSDANGCSVSDTVVVNEPAALTGTMNFTDESCSGNNDGTADFTVSGGTAPYTYNWSTGDTVSAVNGLAPGSYTVDVTDANGCMISDSVTIATGTGLSLNLTGTDESCEGDMDGSVDVSVVGGVSPFTYDWSSGGNAATETGLSAGTYVVTVTDDGGCTGTDSVEIFANPLPVADAGADQTVCVGTQVDLLATGGDSYSWSDGSNTDSTVVMPSVTTTYTVTVTDTTGCSAIDSVMVTVNPDAPIVALPDTGICPGASIDLTVTGGVSYTWDNGLGSGASVNATPDTTTTYIVSGTDGNGCSGMDTVIVTVFPAADVVITPSSSGVCNGDNVSLVVSGGTSYQWNNSLGIGSTVNPRVTQTTTYIVSGTDANGCMDSDTVTITAQSIPVITFAKTAAACGQSIGGVTANVSNGQSPFSYSWEGGETTNALSNIPAGSYAVTVTDDNGCEANKVAAIADLDGPTVAVTSVVDANCSGPDGSIFINVTNGTGPFTYNWSNGYVSQNLTNVAPGSYGVDVTDVNGCVGSIDTTIENIGTNPPSISGHVTSTLNGFTITAGEVYIIRDHGTAGSLDTIAQSTLDANGDFNFSSVLPIGPYYMSVSADTNIFSGSIPTYYGTTKKWAEAQVVNATCDSAMQLDMEVIQLAPLTGTSDVGGTVIADGTNKWNVRVGDPIPGVDVSLEQIPGGIVAWTETDGTGGYNFGNVPMGDYTIYVDVPGLDMADSYDIQLTSDDSTVTDMNFYIGEDLITIQSVHVIELPTEDNTQIRIYPNPFRTATTFEYTLDEVKNIEIEVYDLMGRKVIREQFGTQMPGTYQVQFGTNGEMEANGIYYVQFKVDDKVYSRPIIKQR